MEKHQEMKKFIMSSLEYSQHHADSSLSDLQRHLQILASSTDVGEFDPSSATATEFYVSLHELMNGLESRSMLLWSAVAVLQKACQNPSAKKALIHTYRFVPILTRCLGFQHISDKRLRILQLLIELTYGVKISWQEAHLPYLISTLVQIILEGEKELKPFALGVLVNLCYKNLPALYVLMRKVEITKFIKSITKLNDNANIRMQVCKMLIILEQMKGVLPEVEILNFIDVTFSTVITAFENKDIFLLRHVVDFFKDVKENEHFKQGMVKYKNYLGDTKKIIGFLEREESNEANYDCIGMLLDFISSLLNLDISGMPKLFGRLAAASLKWVQSEPVSIQALGVIQTVVELAKQYSNPEVKDEVVGQLKIGLPSILSILDQGGEEPPKSIEKRARLIGLVTLLAEMSLYSDLRKDILQNVKYKVIGGLFESITNQDLIEDNIFQQDVSELCIQALSLVATLSNFNCDWMSLYSKLLNQRHIQVALAVALYSGSKKMKCQVFALTKTPGCTNDSINFLCDVMCEMKQITNGSISNVKTSAQPTFQDMVPLYNCSQESRLNELISALQEAREHNKIGDASTSAVMELYEYKLAAMGHAERRMQASLEAADACCTGMNHQIAQYRSEVTRLHQMLFYSQQCIEGLNNEKKELVSKLQDITNQMSCTMKTFNQDLKEKTKQLKELEEKIRVKEVLVEALTLENKKLLADQETLQMETEKTMAKLKDIQVKYDSSEQKVKELENILNKYKACNSEFEGKISDLKTENEELKQSLGAATALANHKEELFNESNKALKVALKRIDELERIRELVCSVVTGKK